MKMVRSKGVSRAAVSLEVSQFSLGARVEISLGDVLTGCEGLAPPNATPC